MAGTRYCAAGEGGAGKLRPRFSGERPLTKSYTQRLNAGVAGASARWNGKDANENSAFASATSDAIGKSRRSVEIAAARGEALGDDLGAQPVTGTSLDKGVELDALAKMPKDERKWLAAKEPLPAFAHGRLGWSFSRYLELLPIVTPINASTDATVMTPINATPVA